MADLPRCAVCRVTISPGENVIFRTDGRVQHAVCPEVRCAVCSRPVQPEDPIRRDGEALLHGNCWLKRHRSGAPTTAAAKTAADDEEIVWRVRAKLASGALPRRTPTTVWAGFGKGLVCDGCDQPITSTDVDHEADVDGAASLHLHRRCLGVWEREVSKPSAPETA